MRYYELITEDFKSVTKKFIDAGADPAEVDTYIAQFKALGTKLNNITDPADKNIDVWGKRPFADFQKFVTDIGTQVTPSSQKKDAGTSIDLTTPAQRAAGWNIIIPTDESASCYHGTGTDWCVSKRNQGHFERYFLDNNVTLIFCLNAQQEKWAIADHAKLRDKSEFFTAKDKSLTQEKFDSATGLNSAEIIKSALSHAGVEPARAAAKLTSIPHLIRKALTPDPDLEKKILATKNAKWMYQYTLNVLKAPWPAAEPVIAQNAGWASYYARGVLKAPWPAAEPVIAKSAEHACNYARWVLKAPWPAAEPVIAQNAEWAYEYARYVLKKRFPAAEPVIAQNAERASYYARDVLRAPWPAAEPVIAQNALWAFWYARDVLEAPWPAVEPVIAKSAEWAFKYARDVLEAPWPAAEPVIAQNAEWAFWYARYVLKDPNPDSWRKRYLKAHPKV